MVTIDRLIERESLSVYAVKTGNGFLDFLRFKWPLQSSSSELAHNLPCFSWVQRFIGFFQLTYTLFKLIF